MFSKANKQSISAGPDSVNLLAGRDIYFYNGFPVELIDEKIDEEIRLICKSRVFNEFDSKSALKQLGQRLIEGDFSQGTAEARCRAFAWCARLLVRNELETAKDYLEQAQELFSIPEVNIAKAFVASQEGDQPSALRRLNEIGTPASRSAALMIKAYHEGYSKAIQWLVDSRIEITDLDADGKNFLLRCHLGHENWDLAYESLQAVTEQDLEESPILHHLLAITKLLIAVPKEFRSDIRDQLPLNAAGFPLADDSASMVNRREAREHFIESVKVAKYLNYPIAAKIDEQYALWLELRDPETLEIGKERLKGKLSDLSSDLSFVPLALQFGISLDIKAVENEIERQIALNGGLTVESALTRLTLAQMQDSPQDVANYIDEHFDRLTEFLNLKSIRFLQIEMLRCSGLHERAKVCLQSLQKMELSEAEKNNLSRMIAEAEGADPIEARKSQFQQDDSLNSLLALVVELENQEDWRGLCEYGLLLFERTRSLPDACRLVDALNKAFRFEQVIEFIQTNHDLRLQSRFLQISYAQALYFEGELIKARTELESLTNEQEKPDSRDLYLRIIVSLGDWNAISSIAEKDYRARDSRSANELLRTAHFALNIGAPYSKELLFEAASKGANDPVVLADAYFLATNAGWEDGEVTQWLHKAAELSKEDGPIQIVDLQGLLDRKPHWDRRETEIFQLLIQGRMPLFLAAQGLNQSLIHLMLFPAFTNLLQPDPRRKRLIPAYSGKRLPHKIQLPSATVGMDATALLTLSLLDLLDKALDSIETVYLPHSTLAWLLGEKKKAEFHQPSRVKDAHQVRDLLSQGKLQKLTIDSTSDNEVAANVGVELATLIAEAEKNSGDGHAQHLVIQPGPVYRIASFMEEEADLSNHANVMSSCMAVVEKLRTKGQITASEEKKALNYLCFHEKPWPHQPQVCDNAVLYLDNLAVTYFLQIGLLGKLKLAGFTVILSPTAIAEYDALLAYEGIASQVNDAIEQIRSALNTRIESGKVKIGKSGNSGRFREKDLPEHPTVDLLELVPYCDAIIVDDRALNHHEYVANDSKQTPLFTTLDLIDTLATIGVISEEDRFECLTKLRRAGYFFINVGKEELSAYLSDSQVINHKVVETAELKAVRENILCVRMHDFLQFPQEAVWLDMTRKVLIDSLKNFWNENTDFSTAEIYSNWLLEQADLRGWLHRVDLTNNSHSHVIKNAHAVRLLSLFIAPFQSSPEVLEAYWKWAENAVFIPTLRNFPDLREWLINYQKEQISEIAGREFNAGESL
ncbi:HNH endonuclease [Nodosilinea sp. LEGE 07298]|uniref:HTH domain-containing protein n=1 Tax=Nodosilinea sp. LEGE 07298 TaxID=2777970 RepID=UPI00187F3E50|nr:HNH endonuclease [Nodosilinea sp. LEGE 07298]MBE9109291.1 HNH endonuclease [Nodosilinea sp. LEGE 07298]